MNVPCKTWAGLCSLALLASLGCHEVVLDQTENASALDPEYGKPLMEATPGAGKDDGPGGIRGPLEVFGGSDTEVWAVTNQWHDTDTPDALEEFF